MAGGPMPPEAQFRDRILSPEALEEAWAALAKQ
jgi:hypothetical protein